MSFVLKVDQSRENQWPDEFAKLMPDMPVRVWPDVGDADAVEYMALWSPEAGIFDRFPNLKLVFSFGAGVDQFNLSVLPPSVGLVKMIEPALTAGMVEYVAAQVLATHRDLPLYRAQQDRRVWQGHPERLAAETRVGIMGMGTLGVPCARALAALGFRVNGWARSPRDIEGVSMFLGPDALDDFLKSTDILVSLLPLTDETRGIFDARLFSRLPDGASFINAGRGPQVVTADLIAALDAGRLRWAVLDVTDPEPLPQDSPLWDHPKVVITPHIASNTNVASGVASVVANIRRHQAGETPVGLVDRSRAY
ncbi:2-hydroxyacid dehydrogenase [Tanticharoenia sakaeratensis]|nr:glyoxylate/hydroxypyruvate reductase A [Tanticharoenia sakaeratensis]